ncbi:hypothetical protein [Nostoc sp.]|uniref:hypothetical protein n=1 Tax=Nostoc sp. TaxID=1180 RepID=UPI002FFA17D6
MLKTHTFIIKINPIVAKFTHKLIDKQAKQFEIKTEMFKEFRVENPYKRSLYYFLFSLATGCQSAIALGLPTFQRLLAQSTETGSDRFMPQEINQT